MKKVWQKDGYLYVTNEKAPSTMASDTKPKDEEKEKEMTAKLERLEKKVDELLEEAKTPNEFNKLMDRLRAIRGTGVR